MLPGSVTGWPNRSSLHQIPAQSQKRAWPFSMNGFLCGPSHQTRINVKIALPSFVGKCRHVSCVLGQILCHGLLPWSINFTIPVPQVWTACLLMPSLLLVMTFWFYSVNYMMPSMLVWLFPAAGPVLASCAFRSLMEALVRWQSFLRPTEFGEKEPRKIWLLGPVGFLLNLSVAGLPGLVQQARQMRFRLLSATFIVTLGFWPVPFLTSQSVSILYFWAPWKNSFRPLRPLIFFFKFCNFGEMFNMFNGMFGSNGSHWSGHHCSASPRGSFSPLVLELSHELFDTHIAAFAHSSCFPGRSVCFASCYQWVVRCFARHLSLWLVFCVCHKRWEVFSVLCSWHTLGRRPRTFVAFLLLSSCKLQHFVKRRRAYGPFFYPFSSCNLQSFLPFLCFLCHVCVIFSSCTSTNTSLGWGGVGWDDNVHLHFSHTWCYATVCRLALVHILDATLLSVVLHFLTYLMLRYCLSSCISSQTWYYATVCRLALVHIFDATLLSVVLHFFTYLMLRYCLSSCTSLHTWWYATVGRLAFPHRHDATLLSVVLHFFTYLMLRYCLSSCTSLHTWWYATVGRLAFPHRHDATLLYVGATTLKQWGKQALNCYFAVVWAKAKLRNVKKHWVFS